MSKPRNGRPFVGTRQGGGGSGGSGHEPRSSGERSFLFIWERPPFIGAFAKHVPVALVNSFVVDVIDGNA